MKVMQPEGNYYNKYESKNPIAKLLMTGFFNSMQELLCNINYDTIYEAGCGEGYVTNFIANLNKNAKICASDISDKKIQEASKFVPSAQFSVESIYDISQADDSFDLVIASEVLEHLEQPEKALDEILRISKKYILVSVPNEPIWRVCNVLRGKYWRDLGNTPGHIQHWGKKQFCNMVGKRCQILEAKAPFPWTMLLCEKNNV